MIFDIKKFAVHDGSGVSNKLILENIIKLGESGIPIEVRMPIIPTVNDKKEDIEGAAKFLSEVKNITRVELLPYHKLGESKFERLGREYKLKSLEPLYHEEMNEIAELARSYGLKVHVS